MGGGPKCRIQFIDFTKHIFGMLGMDLRRIVDRKWFALRNFHMQYYEDSGELDKYIHNFRDSIEDYYKQVWDNMSFGMKMIAFLNKILPPIRHMAEKETRKRLMAFAMRKDGTLNWYTRKMTSGFPLSMVRMKNMSRFLTGSMICLRELLVTLNLNIFV